MMYNKKTQSNLVGAVSLAGAALALVAQSALSFPRPPQESVGELEGIGIVERLGATIPPDITITTDDGRTITLGEYFEQDKPVILTLVYYQCPMLCNLVLTGMSESIDDLEWEAGDKYQLLAVSINPKETCELAAQKKINYLTEYTERSGREFNPDGWTFAVAAESESKRLADVVGFQYRLDSATGEYAHSAASFVLTEDGVVSRYLYGIDHQQQTLKLALLEATEGRIGNTLEKIVLYCYRYDPDGKSYVVFATNVMKLGGAVFVLLLGTLIGGLWLRERSRARSPHTSPAA
ncbi:MAG TPA: SCO family protein [candidate division Zixibacteria bacterium]|nr:SCO family protein [candidate division Zixibacteria bacterium]